jgi:nucleotide-binding universal stress UspA family protein
MADPMVVGVDGTADSLAALSTAADMAGEAARPLIVVHVRHESSVALAAGIATSADVAVHYALNEVEQMTRQRVSDVLAGRRVDWQLVVAEGDPATELIAAAVQRHATTIVVGGRSHGVVGGLVMGSVAQKLVRHSPISVLVVRDGAARHLEHAAVEPSA